MTARLSDNMRQALWAISEGRSVGAALPGRGRNVDATLVGLKRRDLLSYGRTGGTMGWEITDAGKALVASWRCAACGHVEYHCPVSGCNHHDSSEADNGFCECEVFVSPTTPGAGEDGGRDGA